MKRPYILPDVAPTKFDGLNPSEVTETSWIYTFRKEGEYFSSTPRSGKWLIFCPLSKIDQVWTKVKKATENGLLGSMSKVATAYENPNAKNSNDRVICVYTYDAEDIKDVLRIRDTLKSLGISWKIPYKLDSATQAAKYAVNGKTKISLYYE